MTKGLSQDEVDKLVGLSEGAGKVRGWALANDAGDGVTVALADLLVESARILDDAAARGAADLRGTATLVRAHREILDKLHDRIPVDEPIDEFAEFLEDLAS